MNERMTNDVDVRGPCGLTPLMLASFRGGGLDSGDLNDEEEGENLVIIQDLIAQGANINTQMDKTGETPLHLAARYARADAAKKLLDAKADANAPDNTGRTPLHAAVAADAQGVFQILLRHRATNLDAKTYDGTTPLILAARLAIEGMVEELIQSDADINASDENGKSALHWAASVNNVDAVNTLLASGANRDAQDHKDETPLFLACREGSFQAAKALLDHCANRDITDHMDRLPRDVAQERLHHDIVRLLEEHVPPAPQPQVSQPILPPNLPTNESLAQMSTPNKGPKPKKRSRTVEGSPIESSMLSPPNKGMSLSGLATLPKNRRPSVKRKKEGHDMSGMMLSPPDSDHSRYDGHMYGHSLATGRPNIEEMLNQAQSKQPPSYDDVMKIHHHQSMASGLSQAGQQHLHESQFFMQQHPRQQSIPASMTPPNSQQQHLSPPHHAIMSPPQSVQSSHFLSPPAGSLGNSSTSPQQQMHQLQQQQSSSPIKSRAMLLPTSPTHLQAMRGATHQRHQSFEFPEQQQLGVQMGYHYTYMPTPPQTGESVNFMTPSPESPSQWSNNSPQSHSDWMDNNIHSPPNSFQQHPFQQQQQLQQQQQFKQQQDAFVI
jgi:Notch-like protein